MIECNTCGSQAKAVFVAQRGMWTTGGSKIVTCPLRSEGWHSVISTNIYNARSWIRDHWSTITKKEEMIKNPAWPASIKRELRQEINELYQKISELEKKVEIEKKLGRQKRLSHNK